MLTICLCAMPLFKIQNVLLKIIKLTSFCELSVIFKIIYDLESED